MSIANDFVKVLESNPLTYGSSRYEYDPSTNTLTFVTGDTQPEITVFDFGNYFVTYNDTQSAISEMLPFLVEQGADHTRVYIQFYDRKVCILVSPLSAETVIDLITPIEQELLLTDYTDKPSAIAGVSGDSAHRQVRSFYTPPTLHVDTDKIQSAEQRLLDRDFIQNVLAKEGGDEKRRIFSRYIPIGVIGTLVLIFLGWLTGYLWVYLAYFFYFVAFLFVLYFVSMVLLPTIQGPDKIYYGRDTNYRHRLGIILPLIDPGFVHDIPFPNQSINSYRIREIKEGNFDTKFILSYAPNTDPALIDREFAQVNEWLSEQRAQTYLTLREQMRRADFQGKIQFVISSITGYMPDASGRSYFRSEIHPQRDNISIYPLEKLAPGRIVLGYGRDELVFIPFYIDLWSDLNG